MQNVVVLGQFWAGPGLVELLHATSLRRSIPQMTLSLSDTDQFDLPSADETVGDMIRILGGCSCRSDRYLYKRIGFSCVVRGRIGEEADSSR